MHEGPKHKAFFHYPESGHPFPGYDSLFITDWSSLDHSSMLHCKQQSVVVIHGSIMGKEKN